MTKTWSQKSRGTVPLNLQAIPSIQDAPFTGLSTKQWPNLVMMPAVVIADMQADDQTKMQPVVTADMLADNQTASLIPSRDEWILSNYWKNLFLVSNCKKTVNLLSLKYIVLRKGYQVPPNQLWTNTKLIRSASTYCTRPTKFFDRKYYSLTDNLQNMKSANNK